MNWIHQVNWVEALGLLALFAIACSSVFLDHRKDKDEDPRN